VGPQTQTCLLVGFVFVLDPLNLHADPSTLPSPPLVEFELRLGKQAQCSVNRHEQSTLLALPESDLLRAIQEVSRS